MKRAALWALPVLLAAGVVGGVALGRTSEKTRTVTEQVTETRTDTVTRTRTIVKRVRPTRTVVWTIAVTETIERPPTNSGLYVDYGRFDGVVELRGLQWYRESYGGTTVVGQFVFLGASSCTSEVLSYAAIGATLFDDTGTIRETGLANWTDVPQGSRFPLELNFQTEVTRGRVEMVVTEARCA